MKDCGRFLREEDSLIIMTDSFGKAKRKAAKAVLTSKLSTDSFDSSPTKLRKRRKPVRYQSESSSSDNEDIISSKKHCSPTSPRSDKLDDSSSELLSCVKSEPYESDLSASDREFNNCNKRHFTPTPSRSNELDSQGQFPNDQNMQKNDLPPIPLNSFGRAKQKAAKAVLTSKLSTNSFDSCPTKLRKRKKPVRYQSESSSSDDECIILSKKHRSPTISRNNELGESSLKLLSCVKSEPYQTDSSASDRESIICDKRLCIPTPSRSGENSSNIILNSQSPFPSDKNMQKNNLPTIPLHDCMLQYLENLNKKIEVLTSKVDRLSTQIEKISCTNINPVLFNHHVPDTDNLPVTSEEELKQLNDKLKTEKEFSANLVRFLYYAGNGRSQRSFINSITKRVLTQEVAVQFSRFGRKGKKSFVNYNETMNVILAAASLKFKDVEREDLSDSFGKTLATASEWNYRKNPSLTVTEDVNS